MAEPTAGTGGKSQVIRQGHTTGKYGSTPHVASPNKTAGEESIKTKSS